MSGGTISGSAIRNNLGVIWSGPVALLVFTALILLDISFSEILMLETVCIVVASLLSHSVAITGFLERFSPMLAKKAFITGLLFLRPEQRECYHVVLVAQFEVFSLGLLHRRESSNTLQWISQIRFFHGRSLLSLFLRRCLFRS